MKNKGVFLVSLAILVLFSLATISAQRAQFLKGGALDEACFLAGRPAGCVGLVASNLRPGEAGNVEEIVPGGASLIRDYYLPADGHLQEWGIDCTNVQEAGKIILATDGTLLKADISVGKGGGVCKFGDIAPIKLVEFSRIIIEGNKITVAYPPPECDIWCKALALFGIRFEPEFSPPIEASAFIKVPAQVGAILPLSAYFSGGPKIVEAQVENNLGEVVAKTLLKEVPSKYDPVKGRYYYGTLKTAKFNLQPGDYYVNMIKSR